MNLAAKRIARIEVTSNPQRIDFGMFIPADKCGAWEVKLIDWAFYATDWVVSSSNNTFSITIGGTTTAVTIPAGNYILTSLVAALDTALKSVSATLAATYDVPTGAITITNTASFVLTFGARAAKLLGFSVGSTAAGTSATGSASPCCTTSAWYGLKLGNMYIDGNDSGNNTFMVTSNAVAGSLITRTAESVGNAAVLPGGVTAVADVALRDQYGENVPLRGQSYMLVFEFSRCK